VTATSPDGKPDTGDLAVVLDASNLQAFGLDPNASLQVFYDGVAKFSVPSGRYWVIGDFTTFTRTGGTSFVDIPAQFPVARNATVHVAASAATSEVTMHTPRPAGPAGVTFTAEMTDPDGNSVGVGAFDMPGQVWVSPMSQKPSAGTTVQAYASAILVSSFKTPGTPYAYNLDYADSPGTVPVQTYQVQPSSLAAVTERFYEEVPSSGAWLIFGGFPVQSLVSSPIGPLSLPGTQVQYFSANPGIIWKTAYFADDSGQFGFPSGGQGDIAWRVMSPGSQAVDWNDYPLHPQPYFSAGGTGGAAFPLVPSAIRTGNTLSLAMIPFSDNVPGHLSQGPSSGTSQTATYQVDQDGATISQGSASDGIPPVALSPKPSVLRFTLDATRTSAAGELSASTQTVWTWRSAPDPGATLPPSWYCSVFPSGQLLRGCAVQALMTLDYQVHGLSLQETVPAGPQVIGLHVGHLQLAGNARITGATAQVSCNDGKTWHDAAVQATGAGNFTISFSEPAGCLVTTRVSASDSAGGSVTETITGAYAVTG
jgi:hypothetical protein